MAKLTGRREEIMALLTAARTEQQQEQEQEQPQPPT
jgi:hypothetical protein